MHFLSSWIRIHIFNADPDPATQINADPCRSGSRFTTLAGGSYLLTGANRGTLLAGWKPRAGSPRQWAPAGDPSAQARLNTWRVTGVILCSLPDLWKIKFCPPATRKKVGKNFISTVL